MRLAVAAALALGLGFPTIADGQAMTNLTFTQDGVELKPVAGKDSEVGIDSILGMKWDHRRLLAAIAQKTNRTGTGPLVDDITAMANAITQTVIAQENMIAFKILFTQQEAARATSGAGSPAEAALAARADASKKLGMAGGAMVSALMALEARRPALAQVIDDALLKDSEQNYDALIGALTDELRKLQDELSAGIARGGQVQVLMTATLTDSAGRPTALHLPGYDDVQIGAPVPFARFNLALDDRARAELAAAEAFVPVVDAIRNGKLPSDLRAAVRDLPQAFAALGQQLRADAVPAIDSTAAELRALATDEGRRLADEFDQLKAALNGIDTAVAPLANPAQPATLAETASRVLAALASARQTLAGLPDRLNSLSARATALLSQKPSATSAAALKQLSATAGEFLKKHASLLSMAENLRAAVESLSLNSTLTNQAESFTRTARNVAAGQTFDTALDLKRVLVERHPGDRVDIGVEINAVGPDERPIFIESDRRTFRLEQRGWYAEPRGALLLVEPTREIANVSFKPTAGFGFQFKHGSKAGFFWNHIVAPSYGFSLALLDFEATRDFELGIAGNLTLFQDMFWLGLGRNLQAEKGYWYVGINPLALSGLFRR